MSDATLLPPNATQPERALEAAAGARLSEMPVRVRDMWNPDTCPVELLPWLAWAFSVDGWSSGWTEEQKREVIRNAVFIHRHKGTLGAVKRALSSLGYELTVIEWFDDPEPAAPYTFRVEVSVPDRGIDEAVYEEVAHIIRDTKNVRSHLAGMLARGVVRGPVHLGSATVSGAATDVFAWAETEIEEGGPLNILAAEYTADFVTVLYQ